MTTVVPEATSHWEDRAQLSIFEELKRLNLMVMAGTICGGSIESSVELELSLGTVLSELHRVNSMYPAANQTASPAMSQNFAEAVAFLKGLLVSAKEDVPWTRERTLSTLLAGYEQMASVLTWLFLLLGSHPEWEDRFHEEIDAVSVKANLSVTDVSALPLTKMLLAETLRLYPPVWLIVRQCLCDQTVGENTFQAGTVLMMSQFAMHRDGRFFEQPHHFLPERWLGTDVLKDERRGYFPFGLGAAGCKGKHYALLELAMISLLIGRYWRIIPYNHNLPEPHVGITLRPPDYFEVIVQRRVPLQGVKEEV